MSERHGGPTQDHTNTRREPRFVGLLKEVFESGSWFIPGPQGVGVTALA
jgi:hypothetical protein